MSIIQEALKKIDKSEAPGQQTPAARPVDPQDRPVIARPAPSAAPAPSAVRRDARPLPARKAAPAAQATDRRRFVVIGGGIALAACLLTALLIGVRAFGAKGAPAPAALQQDAAAPALPSYQETIYKTVETVPARPAMPAAVAMPVAAAPSVVRSAPPDLLLNGIMYLEGGPRAIINNAIVSEGDMVNGATVKTINKKSVILTYNNVEITLNLK